jgi:hypothetical protein
MAEKQGGEGGPTRGTAPSAPDLDKIERFGPSGDARSKASDVDAMGQDKRRQIVGHAYGPSKKSQVIFFAAIATIVVVIIGGYALAIALFDQPPSDNPDKAPWSQASAKQIPTRDPSNPCGEPGNPYPPGADSPCGPGGVEGQAPTGAVSESGITQSGSSHPTGQ